MEEVAFYDFEANDISISQEENIDYEELEPIKEQIILEVKEEISLLKSEVSNQNEEENKSENLTQWESLDNSHIGFDFNWEVYELNKFSTQENWEGFDKNLISVKDKSIETDSWIFIINEWNIYDWSKAQNHYINKIDRLFWYSDKIKIHEALRENLFTKNQKYNFENFDKNVNLLLAIVNLWKAKNTKNINLKEDFIKLSSNKLSTINESLLNIHEEPNLDNLEREIFQTIQQISQY